MTYKAVIPLVSGLVVNAPEWEVGSIRVEVEPGAEAWVPPYSWMAAVSEWVPANQVIRFRLRPADSDFRYRAVNTGNETTILVGPTETPASVKWSVLHEMAHASLNHWPEAADVIRSIPKPENYATNDDAHASVWEEQIADACADHLAPSMGTLPGLNRKWWRAKLKMEYGDPELPSETAAKSLIAREEGGLLRVGWTFVQRAALVGAGLYLFGNRQGLVRNALVASAVIQGFVLYETYAQNRKAVTPSA